MSRFFTLLYSCIFRINTYFFTGMNRIYFIRFDITLPTVKNSLGEFLKLEFLRIQFGSSIL